MDALASRAAMARSCALFVPRRASAAAPPRQLAPVRAAKQAAKQAAPAVTEADVLRALKAMLSQATQDRNNAISRLESRVQKLEAAEQNRQAEAQAQAAAEQKRLAAEQQRQAAEQKRRAKERNRANQLNPACTVFWTSRGYDYAPWNWVAFEDTDEFTVAHVWPQIIDTMADADHWNQVPREWQYHNSHNARQALLDIFNDDAVFDD